MTDFHRLKIDAILEKKIAAFRGPKHTLRPRFTPHGAHNKNDRVHGYDIPIW